MDRESLHSAGWVHRKADCMEEAFKFTALPRRRGNENNTNKETKEKKINILILKITHFMNLVLESPYLFLFLFIVSSFLSIIDDDFFF